MTSDQLENLVAIGQLKKDPARAGELAGLKRSGLSRLADAERAELAFDSDRETRDTRSTGDT